MKNNNLWTYSQSSSNSETIFLKVDCLLLNLSIDIISDLIYLNNQ